MSSQPNFGALLQSWQGGSYVDGSFAWLATTASNLVVPGTNPPYFPADFFGMYPRFGGQPLAPVGTTTIGSATVTIASSISGLATGQAIAGPGIPDGSSIAGVVISPAAITLSGPATATGTGITFTVYSAPLLPATVLNTFITLASASLNQRRWLEMWPQAMNLYVAHLSQLWLVSEGNASSAPGAAAAAGMSRGIVTSKSVGDVSVSYQPLATSTDYGDLALTIYGQDLARLCSVVGVGPIFVL